MKTRILILALLLAALLLAPVGNVEACGPFFEDEVFVSNTQPDDLASFSKGQLGILQAGFDSNEYAVAYRYLNGGTLSAKEQSALKPPSPNPDLETAQQWQAEQDAEKAAKESAPSELWEKARAEYLPAIPAPDQQIGVETSFPGGHYMEYYLNCPNHAFQTAVLTLRERADVWGKSNPALIDWVHAQDAVFSNCDGKNATMPAPAPAGSPVLLKADRAYQTAAAKFYSMKLVEAAQQFTAIAADTDSPWHDWGNYLAARALVRQAFAIGKAANPFSEEIADFDAATMHQAQQILESELSSPHPTPSRAIVRNELNFIRIRTEPDKRTSEICAALAGPAQTPTSRRICRI